MSGVNAVLPLLVAVAILVALGVGGCAAADAPPFRRIELGFQGGTLFPTDKTSSHVVSEAGGGGIYARIFPVHHMSMQFDGGYEVGYHTLNREVAGQFRYKETTALGVAPLLLGIHYDTVPDGICDPFFGVAGGVYYTTITRTAQNLSILAAAQKGLTARDLLVTDSRLLPAVVPRLGFDFRLLHYFNFLIWGQYAYTFGQLQLVNNRSEIKTTFRMDNVSANVGLGLSF